MENCICKLYIKNYEIGIGFLCKFPFNNNLLPVLIIGKQYIFNNINNNKCIKLNINNEIKEIKIDNSRKIYIRHDKIIDIAIIEIKPNRDKIYNYLEIEENDIYKNEKSLEFKYKNRAIYIIYYQNEEINVSYGLRNEIKNKKNIYYYSKIEEGSSGSPILSLKTFKVIGMHYGNSQNIKLDFGILIKYVIDEFNKNKKEINIIYKTNKEGKENIFGNKFVENNKNNIELIINGNKNHLIEKYNLRKGENYVKIIIKNKIIKLEDMFYKCESLKNINELEYLDIKDVNNFSYMFSGCSSLKNIKGLGNWNVSNGINFDSMFQGCSSLKDIKELQNWNVSNGKNFDCMFYECSSLREIKELENWNVSNGNNFSSMFLGCSSLKDIKGLENWNVSNGKDFSRMFCDCKSLTDIKGLENWNVSNGNDFI